MPQPDLRPELLRLEPLAPHLAPALAHDLRVRRPRVEELHDAAPPEVVVEQRSARVVDALREAIVGAHDGDDRGQGRRPPRRHLQRVISAPGLAHHPDPARAPGLAGDPGDHLQRIVLLLDEVLIVQDSVRVAGAAHVDAHAGIAMGGEPWMHGLVAPACEVAFAIRQIFEDRRHGSGLRSLGHPDAGRQPTAVGHRYPDVLEIADHRVRSARYFPAAVTVPIGETQHQLLAGLRVRSRRVGARLDAALVVLRQRTILVIGRGPDFREPRQVIVDAFHGILVNDPRASDGRLQGPCRQRLEEETVVARHMVESVRLQRPPHDADVAVADAAECLRHGWPTVHGVGRHAFAQRVASDLVPRADDRAALETSWPRSGPRRRQANPRRGRPRRAP